MTNMSRVERRKAQNLYEDQTPHWRTIMSRWRKPSDKTICKKSKRTEKKPRQNKNAIIHSTRSNICICAGYRFSHLILSKEPPG